jgi:outer membrane protein OmpA-like peptidoglycan-associated protein
MRERRGRAQHPEEAMSTDRRRFIAASLASVLMAGGLILAAGAGAIAQEGPTQEQILKALKPAPKTRALTAEQSQQAAEDQRFIEGLRGKTRSLTTSERQQVATIARQRPSIDLEVYFDYDSAEITPKAAPDLMNLGKALSDPELAGGVFLLSGYTDAKGGEEYNQRLSERRAMAVKRFLTERFRLPDESLVTAGYGKEQLKNPAQPFAAENRRVQIVNLEAKQKAEK